MIQPNHVVAELSHIIEDDESCPVFVTVTGRVGALFEIPVLDLEAQGAEGYPSAFEQLVAALPDATVLRVLQRASSSSTVDANTFRSEAIGQVGFVERKILISLEKTASDIISVRSLIARVRKRGSAVQEAATHFLSALPRHELAGLGARALSPTEIEEHFGTPRAQIVERDSYLDAGDRVHGVVRLYKPGTNPLDETTLVGLIDEMPLPFEISVSIQKVSRRRADFSLRSRLERTSQATNDPLAAEKQEAARSALTSTALHGAALCELEWICTISRLDEATLRRDLEKIKSNLARVGDVMIETAGCVPSYVAAQVGSPQHFTFLEEHVAVPYYIPIYAFGESPKHSANSAAIPSRTLLAHRLDGSLHHFDQFSRRFLAFNVLICGTTGSGKSVFGNALSSALMQDPDVRMIKIDVGGSYTKECEIFGGKTVEFSLEQPSGVNPFRIFRQLSGSKEAIDTVTEFLSILIREEGERSILKELRSELEQVLSAYVAGLRDRDLATGNVNPSIDDFLVSTPQFPRKKLLSRWATGGVFENALKEAAGSSDELDVRYRYFNFQNIQSAANKDYAEGVMAAVIATVNLEMLRIGDRTKGQPGKRLILFCDETKFFIDRFLNFYQLAAANFRKFGHGLVLMLQNVRSAEYPMPDGTTNRDLILNCPIRVFLKADTEADYLVSQFKFEDHHLRAVVTKPYSGREYREAVLQDDTGTRVVRLYLTDEEYWRMTSTREDVDKYNNLRAAVPGLTVEEAIRCLSISASR